jgi:hypothetical protein
MAAQPRLDISTAFPLPIEVDNAVFLRIAAEHWGMGWNRWFILEAAGAMVLLEAMNADRLHPQAGAGSPLIDEIGTLLGDDGWASGVDYTSQQTTCAIDDPCDAEPRAVLAETSVESATVEAGDSAMLQVGEFHPGVLVHVTSARDYSKPGCTDLPLAWYDIGTIAGDP